MRISQRPTPSRHPEGTTIDPPGGNVRLGNDSPDVAVPAIHRRPAAAPERGLGPGDREGGEST